MMKKIWFLFIILSLASMQALAIDCGLNCSFQDSIKKQMAESHMGMAGHECCHGSEESKEKKKSTSCMEEMNGVCFHEISSTDLKVSDTLDKSIKFNFIQESPILVLIKKIGIGNRYRPKIPNDRFLKYKARLDLYILKDQFLI